MPAYDDIRFSPEELARYDRHLLLPEFGLEAQQKLKAARVLVVGSGGLGSPLLLYLAAAGVGTIGIVDADVVEDSNLQRQVLFGQADLGKSKAEAAAARLQALNPHIEIRVHAVRLQAKNALALLLDYDVIADGTDNFPTRYLVNDACVLLGKTNVSAAVYQFEGQVSVFNYADTSGERGPNYRDLYPQPPAAEQVPNCAEGGVLGVLPGILGSMQALEIIKVVTGVGAPLSGRLFVFDALRFQSYTFKIKRRDDNPLNGKNPSITQLIDYELFCGVKPADSEHVLKEISAAELREWQSNGTVFQLIDVREAHEYQAFNLGATLLPLSMLYEQARFLPRDIKIVLHCHSGVRSAEAVRRLEEEFGFDQLYNLKGGILAYRRMP